MQKTAYEMRISDWSSDVCSSDLLNGASACIGVDDDVRWHGIHQAKVVGCGHSIDKQTQLIAPRDGVHDGAVIWGCCLFGQAVYFGSVVQSTVDTAQLSPREQALERLVHGVSAAKLGKVGRSEERRVGKGWVS